MPHRYFVNTFARPDPLSPAPFSWREADGPGAGAGGHRAAVAAAGALPSRRHQGAVVRADGAGLPVPARGQALPGAGRRRAAGHRVGARLRAAARGRRRGGGHSGDRGGGGSSGGHSGGGELGAGAAAAAARVRAAVGAAVPAAVRACVTAEPAHVDAFLRQLPAVLACAGAADSLLSGRAGTLYLVRMVREWVPAAAGRFDGVVAALNERLLAGAGRWRWLWEEYWGARARRHCHHRECCLLSLVSVSNSFVAAVSDSPVSAVSDSPVSSLPRLSPPCLSPRFSPPPPPLPPASLHGWRLAADWRTNRRSSC